MSLCATWRLELFFKSPTQLKEQIQFIKDNHIQRINLTNKASYFAAVSSLVIYFAKCWCSPAGKARSTADPLVSRAG